MASGGEGANCFGDNGAPLRAACPGAAAAATLFELGGLLGLAGTRCAPLAHLFCCRTRHHQPAPPSTWPLSAPAVAATASYVYLRCSGRWEGGWRGRAGPPRVSLAPIWQIAAGRSSRLFVCSRRRSRQACRRALLRRRRLGRGERVSGAQEAVHRRRRRRRGGWRRHLGRRGAPSPGALPAAQPPVAL